MAAEGANRARSLTRRESMLTERNAASGRPPAQGSTRGRTYILGPKWRSRHWFSRGQATLPGRRKCRKRRPYSVGWLRRAGDHAGVFEVASSPGERAARMVVETSCRLFRRRLRSRPPARRRHQRCRRGNRRPPRHSAEPIFAHDPGRDVVRRLPRRGAVKGATFRADGRSLDRRRPTTVRFSITQEDVRRRDFTINGYILRSDRRPCHRPCVRSGLLGHWNSACHRRPRRPLCRRPPASAVGGLCRGFGPLAKTGLLDRNSARTGRSAHGVSTHAGDIESSGPVYRT